MNSNEDLKTKFLENLRQWGRVGMAAASVGLSAQTIARRRKNFPEFDKDITEALAVFRENTVDILAKQRAEAKERGYYELVSYKATLEAYHNYLSSK